MAGFEASRGAAIQRDHVVLPEAGVTLHGDHGRVDTGSRRARDEIEIHIDRLREQLVTLQGFTSGISEQELRRITRGR